jgi:hypothetical protein
MGAGVELGEFLTCTGLETSKKKYVSFLYAFTATPAGSTVSPAGSHIALPLKPLSNGRIKSAIECAIFVLIGLLEYTKLF